MGTKKTGDGALSRARATLAELAAERARLPRAVCAVCGGVVPAGTGRSDGDLTPTELRTDAARASRGLPAIMGWTRRHEACAADAARVVREVTGQKVQSVVAIAALQDAHPPESGRLVHAIYASRRSDYMQDASGWPGRAWQHLSRTDRDVFAAAVRDAEREYRLRTEPHRCVDGPCGACGVALSRKWWDSPMRWKDGAPAPWCADCGAIARRRPDTSDALRLRAIALEALSGASGMGMAGIFDEHMHMFCELVEPGHAGTAERWEHSSEAWIEVREAARRMFASSLDGDLKAHYTALRRAEAEAYTARERHERQLAERAGMQRAGWTR